MSDLPANIDNAVCPIPLTHIDRIVMGHGSGGKMSHDLISRLFLPPFDNPSLRAGDDSGVVELPTGSRLAISTDAHVVSPLFFPGGDIGRLAVCGTVNDVAMMGATPLYLTASFILEEGLEVPLLQKVISSMQAAVTEAGVQIIAGDTKVVQRGSADKLYITTSGVGIIPLNVVIGGDKAKPGDIIILSGSIGDHGIAVLAARGELGFDADVQSDTAPLNHLVEAMLSVSQVGIHVLRDPTRGGLATTLNEISRQSQVGILIHEQNIPVHPAVTAACEILGFDPLYVANEGKLVAMVDRGIADQILLSMRNTQYGEGAVIIGEVQESPKGRVLMKTTIGSTRVVDMLSGEMLPRIC
jgi:hydrogenase expression/formation protein HypE